MANYQIVGVRKLKNSANLQYISHVAYIEFIFNPKVIIPVNEAIRRIRLNKQEFYIKESRGINYITVEEVSGGTSFLKTTGDTVKRDLLLQLQDC